MESMEPSWGGQPSPVLTGKRVEIRDGEKRDATFLVPEDAGAGETIHLIAEVTDRGTPPLTRYQRVVATLGR